MAPEQPVLLTIIPDYATLALNLVGPLTSCIFYTEIMLAKAFSQLQYSDLVTASTTYIEKTPLEMSIQLSIVLFGPTTLQYASALAISSTISAFLELDLLVFNTRLLHFQAG